MIEANMGKLKLYFFLSDGFFHVIDCRLVNES